MKMSQTIVRKFLATPDVEDDIVVTIKGVSGEMSSDGKEQLTTMSFRELPKSMVLNVTTKKVLINAFGDETDNWPGQQVTLYVDPNVSYQGKVVGGLRLRPLKPKPGASAATAGKPKPKPAAPAEAAEEFNDQIPY